MKSMELKIDRVGELLGRVRHAHRVLVSPEGVPLDVQVATVGERATAFFIDLGIMLLATIVLVVAAGLLIATGLSGKVIEAILGLMLFFVGNAYFLYFELTWQGRTPGKKICHLRVINRNGGELTPAAVIARNLTREVEFFLPLGVLLGLGVGGSSGLAQLFSLIWLLLIAALPLFNREHLRAGDLIGGTQVIAMPRQVLRDDLSDEQNKRADADRIYHFTHEQLAVYGTFELQVLEEFLRRPVSVETGKLLTDVCQKICAKIAWDKPVPPEEIRRFLTDFYTAERNELERGQLFGRTKADKNQSVKPRKTK